MTTKAFTIVAVRLLGLLALLKGAQGIPVLLWALLQYVRSMKANAAPVARMSVLNIAFSVILPIVVGVVCLARTKPIADLVTKGTDEAPAQTEGNG